MVIEMINITFDRKQKRKTEFSKKLLFAIMFINLLIISFTMYMTYKTNDLSSLQFLITGIFAQTATGIGFYYNKAKKENEIKLARKYGEEMVNYEEN